MAETVGKGPPSKKKKELEEAAVDWKIISNKECNSPAIGLQPVQDVPRLLPDKQLGWAPARQ